MALIEGMIESIIYRNDANGYTVCEMAHGIETVTLVGYMPFTNEGEFVRATGAWTSHPDYGEQFKVEAYENVMPKTADAIEKYLASGVIKGIGPVTAKKIVEKFGEDSIEIIQFYPLKLAVIKGITAEKAQQIGRIFESQRELMDIVIFLQKFGMGPSYSTRIYKAFGSGAIEQIKRNPYRLSDEIFGIGFKTSDRIAMSLGLDPYSKFRISSAIKYVLSKAAEAGHTYLPKDKLTESTCGLLEVEGSNIDDALESLQLERSVNIEKEGHTARVYLSSFFNAEKNASIKLHVLCNSDFKAVSDEIAAVMGEVEKEEGIKLASLQEKAVREAILNGVLVITGGPGTGKTTVIKNLIRIFMDNGSKVELAAPTGRAAKRMTEATGIEARTIHRLLETGFLADREGQIFQRNETNPLEADAVIIDEMSMVDILLFNSLLKALTPGTRLIMVGDADQLSSVGPGNVLRDIISSEMVPTVRLTEIFRQSEESKIVWNAHLINKGEIPDISNKDRDFFFMKRSGGESILEAIKELCCQRLPDTYGYSPMKDIQVLTPTRKGIVGVSNLNAEIRKVLNPPSFGKTEKMFNGYLFREGDKVMQVRNDYSLGWEMLTGSGIIRGEGVFNGDMGTLAEINEDELRVSVSFDDNRNAQYDFSMLDEIEPAYAVTIHKSQGSEFPAVIIPMYPGHPMLLTRNLIYTAVTRAREMVVLVGSFEVFKAMVNNVREDLRYSGLKDKIIRGWQLRSQN
ncbi:MAG: ATP-dependent RecD-like DNA helicase [Eubacteriales bacterium]|nr:ATP-dependent RecD-like DNA helicase [Eubacteriales bacterium]